MNTLTRWDPYQELDDLQNRLSYLFGRAPIKKNSDNQEALSVPQWAPLVDISEDENEYLIKAELPEVKNDKVKVSLQNDVLSITGERNYEKEEKNKKVHRIERAYRSFSRTFTVPEDTDSEQVSAEFKEGILKVHLPKTQKAKPKSIDVKVN
ncbi:MAG: molecular chaperone [Nitrospirales bacterium]|nr:MAG: molecular chaperone [Nitrospirales bacterium]